MERFGKRIARIKVFGPNAPSGKTFVAWFANVRDSLVIPECLCKNSGENFEVQYFIGNSTKLTNSQLWFHSTSLIQIRFVIVNPLDSERLL